MTSRAIEITPKSPALLVVAAPKEAEAVLRGASLGHAAPREFHRWEAILVRPGIELVVTGIGKACAAGAVATVFDPDHHGAIVNIGIAGSLPGSGLALRDVIAADRSVYGDEGIETPEGFQDVASMGFSPAPPGFEAMGLTVPADPALLNLLRPLADRVGPIATVSTCSGTDATALSIEERTGALAETMEGAAAGFTGLCAALAKDRPAPPFAEVRVISNTTGDRQSQWWDLRGSLDRLSALSDSVVSALLS